MIHEKSTSQIFDKYFTARDQAIAFSQKSLYNHHHQCHTAMTEVSVSWSSHLIFKQLKSLCPELAMEATNTGI